MKTLRFNGYFLLEGSSDSLAGALRELADFLDADPQNVPRGTSQGVAFEVTHHGLTWNALQFGTRLVAQGAVFELEGARWLRVSPPPPGSIVESDRPDAGFVK